MKSVIIPEAKMQSYLEWCKKQTPSTVICCSCNKIVEVELSPYFYDEDENDVYFASICPECGGLLITKE